MRAAMFRPLLTVLLAFLCAACEQSWPKPGQGGMVEARWPDAVATIPAPAPLADRLHCTLGRLEALREAAAATGQYSGKIALLDITATRAKREFAGKLFDDSRITVSELDAGIDELVHAMVPPPPPCRCAPEVRKLLRLMVALMMLLTAVLPAAAQGQGGNELRLNVGDLLQLTLPSEDAFTNPFKVDREGNIDLPEAGPVSVAGLTIAQARDKVRAALAISFRDLDHFNLALKEHRLPLTVLGFVKQPGQIEIPAGSSAQIAINTAGGVTPGGQLDHMQVRRIGPDGQPQVIVFDYKKYLDTGDPRILPPLRPLDEIFVPASPQIGNVQVEFDARSLESHGDAGEGGAVRVFGEVATSGTYAFKPGMTVMDALLRAGGVTRYAATEQIRILPATGEPVLFNLKGFLDSGRQALNVPCRPAPRSSSRTRSRR